MAVVSVSRQHSFLKLASCLFTQQIWCWGRDIERPDGNWLLEIGFERIEPPTQHSRCPSIYKLQLPQGRHILLRGFGVYFGDIDRGGVFLPRYDFQPQYSEHAELNHLPWRREDLPQLIKPSGAEVQACASLLSDCVDWICQYESQIIEQLGIGYRQTTLREWDTGSRSVIPAEDIAPAWRAISLRAKAGLTNFQKPATATRLPAVGKLAARFWMRSTKQRPTPNNGPGLEGGPRTGVPI